jgi:hypothetical protein
LSSEETTFFLGLPRPISPHLRDDLKRVEQEKLLSLEETVRSIFPHLRDDLKRDEQGRRLSSEETTPINYFIDTGDGSCRFV